MRIAALALGLLIAALASPALAISFTDNGISAGVSGPASATITTTHDSPVGSHEMVAVLMTNYGGTAPAVSDNAATPNTYTLIKSCSTGTGSFWIGVFDASITTDLPSSGTITVTNINFGNVSATLVSSTAGVDGTGSCANYSSGTSLDSGAATVTNSSGGLAAGFTGAKFGSGLSQGTGYVAPPTFTATLDSSGASLGGSKTYSGSGTVDYNASTSGSLTSGSGSIVVAYKATGGATTTLQAPMGMMGYGH